MGTLFIAMLAAGGAFGAYKLVTKTPFSNQMGEIYAIGLMGVPMNAGVELVGEALSKTMGWNANKMVLDGMLSRGAGGLAVLTVVFRASIRTPTLPSMGTQVRISDDATATVTFVLAQPANAGITAGSFP